MMVNAGRSLFSDGERTVSVYDGRVSWGGGWSNAAAGTPGAYIAAAEELGAIAPVLGTYGAGSADEDISSGGGPGGGAYC